LTRDRTNAARVLLIVDPARCSGREVDRLFSDRLARAFHAQGWIVKWVVDIDDDLPQCAYASIQRILPPSKIRTGVSAEPTANPQSPQVPQNQNRIAHCDRWASTTWKSDTRYLAKSAALGVHMFLRIFYRIQVTRADIVAGVKWEFRRLRAGLSATQRSLLLVCWRSARRLASRIRRIVLPAYPRVVSLADPYVRWTWSRLRPHGSVSTVTPVRSTSSLLPRTAMSGCGGDGSDGAHGPSLLELLQRCGNQDLIVFPAAEAVHLEMLLQLLPGLEITAPLPTTLHMRFASMARLHVGPGELDTETIAARLANGTPVRSLVFHADGADEAARYSREIGLTVGVIAPDVSLTNLIFCHPAADSRHSGTSAPSLVVEKLGPVALVISALWGRVGSSAVFEAQTRYLIARGYIVARVLIEHWPHYGKNRRDRLATLVAENFEHVRPHFHFIAERNESPRYLGKLATQPEFRCASPIRRIQLLLAEPVAERARPLAWCANCATLAIVNHLPHVTLAERLTRAPIVLETHDIYSRLLDAHGIPAFVPKGPDGKDLRIAEEEKVWARVAACVNLSPQDHEDVARVAKFSVVARPYAIKRHRRRSWLEVLAENRLDSEFHSGSWFDVMLWGSRHAVNAQSITWFLDEVVTRHEALQRARILIVGRVIEELDQTLLRRNNLLVAGFVDSLDDFASRTKVLVIADQCGTGISMKAMDAFALGACFASTKFGMRGFDLGDTGYVPATDAKALSMDIVRLLTCASARRERTDLARRLYNLNFSAEVYTRAWDRVLAAVTCDKETTQATTNSNDGVVLAPATAAVRRPAVKLTPAKAHANPVDDGTPQQKPRLTVVVCTYDRYDVLPDALASLLAQDCGPGFLETIVIDNSPDQVAAATFSARYAEERRVRYVLESTPGLSNARNVGVRSARADIVAFVDDDAIAAPNWANEIVRAFENGNRVGVVGGRVVPRWVSSQPMWLSDSLLGNLSIVDWGSEKRQLKSTEWLVGCNIAFDKVALMAAGGFNRALGRIGSDLLLLSGEEIEVIEKITAAGHISIYTPAAIVEHVINPAKLTREWFRRRSAWQAVSDFIKNPEWAARYAPAAGEHLRLYHRSAARRAPLGFYDATEDPNEFKQDMGLAYDLVIAMLSGGVDLGTRAPLSAQLTGRARAILQTRPWLRRAAHKIRRIMS
jgi:glucosyl-dolichyl phosphate glucuronosyltransferase